MKWCQPYPTGKAAEIAAPTCNTSVRITTLLRASDAALDISRFSCYLELVAQQRCLATTTRNTGLGSPLFFMHLLVLSGTGTCLRP